MLSSWCFHDDLNDMISRCFHGAFVVLFRDDFKELSWRKSMLFNHVFFMGCRRYFMGSHRALSRCWGRTCHYTMVVLPCVPMASSFVGFQGAFMRRSWCISVLSLVVVLLSWRIHGRCGGFPSMLSCGFLWCFHGFPYRALMAFLWYFVSMVL